MYQIIPAEEEHLDQMVPLFASTGYWEAGLRRNNLCLSAHQFIREYIAKPNLPFTTIVVRNDDQKTVLGLLTCGSKEELESIALNMVNTSLLRLSNYLKNCSRLKLQTVTILLSCQ